jgi:hypothetical protein
MLHVVGKDRGQDYTDNELREIEGYINNSIEIQKVLQQAPNKTPVQPNLKALLYMVGHADSYRDSNHNPVMVFLPGAISIAYVNLSSLINSVAKSDGNVRDIGFFGVGGLVWAIILADKDVVKTYLELGAPIDQIDEMRNKSVMNWIKSTAAAMADNADYCERLNEIAKMIKQYRPVLAKELSFFAVGQQQGETSMQQREEQRPTGP